MIRPEPVNRWMVLISGYLQLRGEETQGIPALRHKLQDLYANRTTIVEGDTWDSNFPDIAENIFRMSQNCEPPTVMIVAYSWGAGYGFVQLAKELRLRGLRVNAAVLSDAVYHLGGRWCHKLGISQVAAYCKNKIVVPGNVDQLYWFRQHNSRLRGHTLVSESTGEMLDHCQVIEGTEHKYMDECPLFQARAIATARELFGKCGGT